MGGAITAEVGNPFSCCEKTTPNCHAECVFGIGDRVYCPDKMKDGIVFAVLPPNLIHPYTVGFRDGDHDVFADHDLVLLGKARYE